jgi:flotillin
MNPQYTIILLAAFVVLIPFVFMGVWLCRYTKVGPNQVLIVSGRKVQLPDGTFAGFRIVKGGGTFVWPIIERVDVLSLEVTTIEMPRSRAQTAGGRAIEADCIAQIKINSEDASIVAAAEHFLNKRQPEIKNIVRPVLEKHLSEVLGSSSIEETIQNPAACAARVQTSAAADLGKMGLSLISFTIRNTRGAS